MLIVKVDSPDGVMSYAIEQGGETKSSPSHLAWLTLYSAFKSFYRDDPEPRFFSVVNDNGGYHVLGTPVAFYPTHWTEYKMPLNEAAKKMLEENRQV